MSRTHELAFRKYLGCEVPVRLETFSLFKGAREACISVGVILIFLWRDSMQFKMGKVADR